MYAKYPAFSHQEEDNTISHTFTYLKKSIGAFFFFWFPILSLTKESQQPYLEQIFLLVNIGNKMKNPNRFPCAVLQTNSHGKGFSILFFFLFNANVRCYVTLKNIFFLVGQKIHISIEHASWWKTLGTFWLVVRG